MAESTNIDCPVCGGELLPTPNGMAVCINATRGACAAGRLRRVRVPYDEFARACIRAPGAAYDRKTGWSIGGKRVEKWGHTNCRAAWREGAMLARRKGRLMAFRVAGKSEVTNG